MPSIFKTCRSCKTPDLTVRWRGAFHMALCSPCALDAEREAVRQAAESLKASVADFEMVRLSPKAAALAARG
jgi:hypothetical protein